MSERRLPPLSAIELEPLLENMENNAAYAWTDRRPAAGAWLGEPGGTHPGLNLAAMGAFLAAFFLGAPLIAFGGLFGVVAIRMILIGTQTRSDRCILGRPLQEWVDLANTGIPAEDVARGLWARRVRFKADLAFVKTPFGPIRIPFVSDALSDPWVALEELIVTLRRPAVLGREIRVFARDAEDREQLRSDMIRYFGDRRVPWPLPELRKILVWRELRRQFREERFRLLVWCVRGVMNEARLEVIGPDAALSGIAGLDAPWSPPWQPEGERR